MAKVISLRLPTDTAKPAAQKEVKTTPSMAVLPAAREYLAAMRGKLTAHSHRDYRQKLTVFAEWCSAQGVTLEHVNQRTVDQFVDHLRATHHGSKTGQAISTYTLAGYVRVIKAFLQWCSEDPYGDFTQFVKPDTPRLVKLPKTEIKIVETFSDEQIEALIMAAKQNYNEHLRLRDACIVQVLVETGIRAFELCGLTLANTHLDPDRAYLKIHGKGNKWRQVPLGNHTRRTIQHYILTYRQGAEGNAPLFVDRAERDGLTVNGLEEMMDRLGRWAGIEGKPRCSPHTLRHTFAARFIRRSGSIHHLQKMLGHSSVVTTEAYCRSLGSYDFLHDLVAAQLR